MRAVTVRTSSKSVFLSAGALTAHGEGFPALHNFWIRLPQSAFVNNQTQYKWSSRTLPGNISEETARLNRDLMFRIEATHFSAYTALLFIFENVRRELWEKTHRMRPKASSMHM